MLTALYRHFSSTNQLLYIGVTYNPEMRDRTHRQASSWWPQVTHITVTHFPTRLQAEAAERHAIASEHPLHNKPPSRLGGRRTLTSEQVRLIRHRLAEGIDPFIISLDFMVSEATIRDIKRGKTYQDSDPGGDRCEGDITHL